MAHWKIYLKNGTIFEDEKYKYIEHTKLLYRIKTYIYDEIEIIKRNLFGFKKEKSIKKERQEQTMLIIPTSEILYCELIEEKDK